MPSGVDSPTETAVKLAIDDSFIGGFRLVMFIAAGLALLSAGTAKLLIDGL
jgi:hypothetical protein